MEYPNTTNVKALTKRTKPFSILNLCVIFLNQERKALGESERSENYIN